MSYAEAASSGVHSQGRSYNENLLVCQAGNISHERVAEALYKDGYWNSVRVYQKVDLSKRYAVELDNPGMRDRLMTMGLNVDGVHLQFLGHQRSVEPRWKVFVSQLPAGITKDEIRSGFKDYGDIKEVQVVIKFWYQKRFDTGDRIVIFKALVKHIPSYVRIRGWNAYVKFYGQPGHVECATKLTTSPRTASIISGRSHNRTSPEILRCLMNLNLTQLRKRLQVHLQCRRLNHMCLVMLHFRKKRTVRQFYCRKRSSREERSYCSGEIMGRALCSRRSEH